MISNKSKDAVLKRLGKIDFDDMGKHPAQYLTDKGIPVTGYKFTWTSLGKFYTKSVTVVRLEIFESRCEIADKLDVGCAIGNGELIKKTEEAQNE